MVGKETKENLQKDMKDLPHWRLCPLSVSMERDIEFLTFSEAIEFIVQVARLAEMLDHHPHFQNTYTHVKVQLSTHECGGITKKDLDLAHRIEALLP